MTDNGFLILNQVRIPRQNMLMKNAKVQYKRKFCFVISESNFFLKYVPSNKILDSLKLKALIYRQHNESDKKLNLFFNPFPDEKF